MMLTTVTNLLLPNVTKYLLPVLIIVCIVLGFIVKSQYSTINNLNEKLVTVETNAKLDLALYDS